MLLGGAALDPMENAEALYILPATNKYETILQSYEVRYFYSVPKKFITPTECQEYKNFLEEMYNSTKIKIQDEKDAKAC